MWYSSSSGLIELNLTKRQAESVSGSGRQDENVAALMRVPSVRKQLQRLNPATVAAELRETGGWDTDELQDHEANLSRLLWIAGNDIVENAVSRNPRRRSPTRASPSIVAAHARGVSRPVNKNYRVYFLNPAPRGSSRFFKPRGKSRRLKHPTRKPSRATIAVIELRGVRSRKLRARVDPKVTDMATIKKLAKDIAVRFREAVSAHRVQYAPSAAYARTK